MYRNLIAIVFSFLLPYHTNYACVDIPSFDGYSFVNMDVLHMNDGFYPYMLDAQSIFDAYVSPKKIQRDANIEEWSTRFCNRAKPEDIAYVVYNAPGGSLQAVINVIQSKSLELSSLGPDLSANSFIKYLHRNKCVEALEYLIFAKSCEPYAIRGIESWKTDRTKDVKAMMALIDQGKTLFINTKSHYFRLRYAYQLMRMAHYAEQYEYALKLYDYLRPKIDNDPSIIEYWMLGHKAGALMALGRNVEASYLYAKIFDEVASKRTSAFRSFHINTDDEWQACLMLCQNDHERAMLYGLRAHAEDARLVEEMKHIYDLDPTNKLLEPLLMREVLKLEKDLLGDDFNDKTAQNHTYYNIPRADVGNRVINLQTFVREVVKERKVKRPDLWMVIEGYLEVLAGNYYFAEETFREAAQYINNDTLENQLTAFKLVLEILSLKEMDDRAENRIDNIRRGNDTYVQYADFPDFMRDKMAFLYAQQGDEAKSFLCYYDVKDLKGNPPIDIIDELFDLCRDPDKDRLEKTLIRKGDGATIEHDVLDIKASYHLSEFKLSKAVDAYEEMADETYWGDYGIYNPFVERLQDCVHCPLPDTVTGMNKGELLHYLVDLEQQAIVEPNHDKAALNFYRLGLAWYNMSYFGYSWKVMDYYRSGSSLKQAMRQGDMTKAVPRVGMPYGNKENFDCTKALYYFDKAAHVVEDPELRAKILFMAAKCEQKMNLFKPKEAYTYYYYDNLIQKHYSTQFFKDIIGECKYFNHYYTTNYEVPTQE